MTQADFFRPGATPPRMLDVLAAMHASDPDRWLPRRLVLQNYWLFGEAEIFHFARGNLMLTGQNESGKSTVLVTAITLVLDMMLTPDRVDTMGSNDRSIRYYLVGKDDAPADAPGHHRERTAYIALEFERGHSGVFQTVGIGLRSSRDWTNQKVERWGFVMSGPRRVAVDFHLHDGRTPARPLRPGELRDRLGAAGQVFTEQAAYKAAVNEALFGFETTGDYERFLEMLHVVRTPKLGEGLNPRKVEAYLKESLPPIGSAAIEGASEVFSRLDNIEAELDVVRRQLAAARALEGPQEAAVLAVARQVAAAYAEASRGHRNRRQAHEKLVAQIDTARAEIAARQEERGRLAAERAEAGGRLAALQALHRVHDAAELEERLSAVRAEGGAAAAALAALRRDREAAHGSVTGEEEGLAREAASWAAARGRLAERLEEVGDAARRAFWTPLARRAEGARDALDTLAVEGTGPVAGELARSAVEGEAQGRRAALAAVLAAHAALGAASARLDASRRASEVARAEYGAADDRFRAAARESEAARAAAAAALDAWRAECAVLRVSDEAFAEVLARLDAYAPQGHRPAAVVAPLQAAFDEAQDGLRAHAVELDSARRRLSGEMEEVEARLRGLAAERDVEPERTPARAAARRLLREHGIAHLPLFAACDPGGALGGDGALAARVEAALEDAGLLDALVVPAGEVARVRALLDAHGVGDRWIAPGDADSPSAEASTESTESTGSTDGAESSDDAAAWLVPAAQTELAADDVRAALRALGLDGGAVVVGADGGWRLGPLRGLAAAPADARVRFLGETARREERRRRLEEAQARRAELRGVLETLADEIETVHGQERLLGREWRAAQELPPLQALHDRLLDRSRAEEERERRRQSADIAAGTVETDTRAVQEAAAALERATDDAPYLRDRSRGEVDAAAAALRDVVAGVRAVGDEVARMEEVRRAHAARLRTLAALRLRVEELAPRIAGADERARTLDAQLRTLEAQLAEANVGREALAAEIAALGERLAQIAALDEAGRRATDRAGATVDTLSAQEPDYAEQLATAAERLHAAEGELRQRVEAYPTLAEYVAAARESGPARAAQRLLHDVDTAKVDDEVRRAREVLQTAFLQASVAFEALSPSLDGDVVRFTHELGTLRLDELHGALEVQQARNENLLEAEDRRLIEQLMLRDVVDAIRDAIRNTRRWVEEINETLGRMQLFKGGIMRLHWQVRPREAADAFDPRRLDDLLTQRGIALDETRREELMEIFRTMVSDIRRRSRERELLVDYATALREMVAYTQWYTLSVERRDEAGRWMPLTRRVYGQGSGGRRTLDLLLPLIAAVSARLATASAAAPRLVGFDEAFAGVDDRNAAEIYALLNELGLCWIMATEKSAGVGAGVRGSATYELLTDGATVAPLLTLWDGERRMDFVGDELVAASAAPPAREAGRGS